MIRPELAARARRWRESLSGAALAGLGLWAAIAATGLLGVLGWLGFAAGLALAVAGVQRARFRAGEGEGPGVVQVTEGRIAYFGPLDGGVVALDLLSEVSLEPRSHPPVWVLRHGGGPSVHIPVTAAGAEALFDVFEQLPGLDMQHLLALRAAPPAERVSVWRVSPARRLG